LIFSGKKIMNILVTGRSDLLDKNLLIFLLSKNTLVLIFDNLSNSSKDDFGEWLKITN